MTNWSWLEEWVRKDKRGLGKSWQSIFWPEWSCSMMKTDLNLMTKERMPSMLKITSSQNTNILFPNSGRGEPTNNHFWLRPKTNKTSGWKSEMDQVVQQQPAKPKQTFGQMLAWTAHHCCLDQTFCKSQRKVIFGLEIWILRTFFYIFLELMF